MNLLLPYSIKSEKYINTQMICMWLGERLFGLGELFTFLITVHKENVYQVVGIFVAMFINFYIYDHFIWKHQPKEESP